jgi:hypothetical protein
LDVWRKITICVGAAALQAQHPGSACYLEYFQSQVCNGGNHFSELKRPSIGIPPVSEKTAAGKPGVTIFHPANLHGAHEDKAHKNATRAINRPAVAGLIKWELNQIIPL